MTYNYGPMPHDYYHRPLDSQGGCYPAPPPPPPRPCPNPGLHANPAAPWSVDLIEHNSNRNSHPYLLDLIKNASGEYYCKDTIEARDAIKEEYRKVGTMVYVSETDELYRLEKGISNSDWKTLNVNSQQYIKLGRLNPPLNPDDGTVYFNLIEEKLYVYLNKKWIGLPNMKDVKKVVLDHNADPYAHAERFAEVENIWFTI